MMNKIKVTRREMNDNYRIVSIGYCEAQNLLSMSEAVAYSSGIYGWSCDYYNVGGVLISTGYAPLSNKNVTCDYQLIKKYEKKAEAIRYNNDTTWQTKQKKLNNLLNKFIKEIIK